MPRAAVNRLISELPGLGPKSALWLREAGIETEQELRRLGAVAAYQRVKHLFPRGVTLNMLWGLEAALTGIRWTEITAERKSALLDEIAIRKKDSA